MHSQHTKYPDLHLFIPLLDEDFDEIEVEDAVEPVPVPSAFRDDSVDWFE